MRTGRQSRAEPRDAAALAIGWPYRIDWKSDFTACSAEDVVLDQTPIEGQPDGKSYGKAWSMDYSGLVGGRTAGIAIFEHPGNLNAPTT